MTCFPSRLCNRCCALIMAPAVAIATGNEARGVPRAVGAVREALQMKKLKTESRRLLDTVKNQSARIRDLETGSDTHADALFAGPGQAGRPVERSSTLDEITGKRHDSDNDGGVFDLEDAGENDVDSLLKEIRAELDDI